MNRRGKLHGKKQLSADEKAGFGLGVLYSTLEKHINQFAATEGCPYSVTDAAFWMGAFLQAKALREAPGDTELVPQVRTDGPRLGLPGTVAERETVHVRPRHTRSLSLKARRNIARAQRERWAKFHRAQAKQDKTKKKRKLTPGQLAAMRANIALGREKKLKALKAAA